MLSVSLIVPTLNEENTIEVALQHLSASFPECELIVVDGGSSDETITIAKKHAHVRMSAPGRANQMNAGAAASSGSILWFIHADSHVDAEALLQIQQAMENKNVAGGGLTLRFIENSVSLQLIAKLSNCRARHLQWIFGDQSMFVRRKDFEAVDGFPSLPIMEDLEISRNLKRQGKMIVLPAVSKTSARRFIEHGTWRTLTRMQAVKLQYFLGVDPDEIWRNYSKTREKVRS